jgi:DMSO/TMAO reductase YedYZ molybdopterin-dependent catalytic subunit
MRTSAWFGIAAALLVAAVAAPALAQKKPAGKGAKGVMELAEVTIVGRVQKPVAAVDVARIRPRVTLAELRQPFFERMEEAIYKEPF